MYYLAEVFPAFRRLRIPFTRDQIILLFTALNEALLGLDVFLAHLISGTIVPYEWIPIIFGPVAGAVLLGAGLLARRNRNAAVLLASGVFLASILVGVLGSYFHIIRASIPAPVIGRWLSMDMLVWAPPVLGPISFAGIAMLGLSATWTESPADSGSLKLGKGRKLNLPYSKTRGYMFLVSFGILAAVVSSALDHARTGFESFWVWVPLAAGVFATLTAAYTALLDKPSKMDILNYAGAMALLIGVGLVGAWLHVQADLTSESQFVVERFLRGAPFMAPLQFANLGLLGLVVGLSPQSE
ncbi:MAG: hypothetical protein OEV06_07770 [Anaerolineae bacterium]|nr:hypothetical protein [Anaerolineae bacterium]